MSEGQLAVARDDPYDQYREAVRAEQEQQRLLAECARSGQMEADQVVEHRRVGELPTD